MSTNIVKAAEIAAAYNYPQNHLNKREQKVLEVSDQYAPATPGDWSPAPASVDAALDQLAANNSGSSLKTLVVTYDFSVNGGATGSIPLGVSLPDNAVVVEVVRDEVTAATSTGSTGTIMLNVPTDGNLEAAALTADGGSPTLIRSSTTQPVKTTAARQMQVTIATNPVTAGKILYFVRYYQSI